jgi:hypothetical protein
MTWGDGVLRLGAGLFAGGLDFSQPSPAVRSGVASMAVTGTGDTVVLTSGCIRRYSRQWEAQFLGCQAGSSSLAVDPSNDDLIVTSVVQHGGSGEIIMDWYSGGAVRRQDASGATTTIAEWPSSEAGGMAPGRIVTGRDGHFYFVDWYSSRPVFGGSFAINQRGNIVRLRSDGSTEVVLPRQATDTDAVLRSQLAVASDGTVYQMLDGGLRRLRGGALTQLVASGRFPPTAWLAVDTADRVLIADREVIYEAGPEGQLTVRAGVVRTIGPRPGPLPAVLPQLVAIAPARDGLLYAVADNLLLTIRF